MCVLLYRCLKLKLIELQSDQMQQIERAVKKYYYYAMVPQYNIIESRVNHYYIRNNYNYDFIIIIIIILDIKVREIFCKNKIMIVINYINAMNGSNILTVIIIIIIDDYNCFWKWNKNAVCYEYKKEPNTSGRIVYIIILL